MKRPNLSKCALKASTAGLTAALSITFATVAVTPVAAEYPDRPVTFVVPFPPGDLEDVLTRLIADDFQTAYGVPAAVVNKPGGGGGPFPGAAEVARMPADGSVVGSFVNTVPIIGPKVGIPELNPMPFEPLGIFVTYPFLIATARNAPYQDMHELAAYAKDHDVVLGVFGAGFPPARITMALTKKLEFEYSDVSAFDALDCNTLASGDADVINTTMQLVLPCLDQITVLATVTKERISVVPDAPTVGEFDPSLSMDMWNGLFVRKEVPQDVRDKIIAVAKKTVLGERAQKIAKDTGAQIYWMDAAEANERIARDAASLAEIGKTLE